MLAIAVGRCSSEFVRNDEASFRFRRYITGGQLSREFVREGLVPNFKLRDLPFPRVPRCPVAPHKQGGGRVPIAQASLFLQGDG